MEFSVEFSWSECIIISVLSNVFLDGIQWDWEIIIGDIVTSIDYLKS